SPPSRSTQHGMVNAAPPPVYRTGRAGDFTYTLPGFAVGSSNTIRLHFAETQWTAAGQRLFNVSINGIQVLASFDVIVAAGGPGRATIKEFVMAPDMGGQYVIQFTSVVDQAFVCGIEAAPSGRAQGTRVNAGGAELGPFVA